MSHSWHLRGRVGDTVTLALTATGLATDARTERLSPRELARILLELLDGSDRDLVRRELIEVHERLTGASYFMHGPPPIRELETVVLPSIMESCELGRLVALRTPRPAWTVSFASPTLERQDGAREDRHDLSFHYISNTGHPISDDEGFELVGPDGEMSAGHLDGGRLERRGVTRGRYELKLKQIKSVRWSTTTAHPFDPVGIEVRAMGFPDGEPVKMRIELAFGPPDASPIAELTTSLGAGLGTLTWAYEQPVSGSAKGSFRVEVGIRKKRALSAVLSVVAHPASSPRGIQERLRAAGYDPGPPANTLTDTVRKALQDFQSEHPPLLATGELDDWTLDALESELS